MAAKGKCKATPAQRLARIAEIIESVDNRCMAYDGPVGDTREEMTKEEMREIYELAAKDDPIELGSYPTFWPREVLDACQDAAQQAPEHRSFFARTIKYLSDEYLRLRAECDREADALIQRAIEDTFAACIADEQVPTVSSVRAAQEAGGK